MAWEQLLSIFKEAEFWNRAEKNTPPVACPNDGEPLESTNDGKLHCPFDGYMWPE